MVRKPRLSASALLLTSVHGPGSIFLVYILDQSSLVSFSSRTIFNAHFIHPIFSLQKTFLGEDGTHDLELALGLSYQGCFCLQLADHKARTSNAHFWAVQSASWLTFIGLSKNSHMDLPVCFFPHQVQLTLVCRKLRILYSNFFLFFSIQVYQEVHEWQWGEWW